jgi:hypothetical protein
MPEQEAAEPKRNPLPTEAERQREREDRAAWERACPVIDDETFMRMTRRWRKPE